MTWRWVGQITLAALSCAASAGCSALDRMDPDAVGEAFRRTSTARPAVRITPTADAGPERNRLWLADEDELISPPGASGRSLEDDRPLLVLAAAEGPAVAGAPPPPPADGARPSPPRRRASEDPRGRQATPASGLPRHRLSRREGAAARVLGRHQERLPQSAAAGHPGGRRRRRHPELQTGRSQGPQLLRRQQQPLPAHPVAQVRDLADALGAPNTRPPPPSPATSSAFR